MTANEKRLFRILLGCAFGAVIIPLGTLGVERLNDAEKSIEAYATAIAKTERYDQNTAIINTRIEKLKSLLGDTTEQKKEKPFSEFAAEARALLSRYGIEPLRYQVVGTGDDVSVEFNLKCETLALLKFLREASLKGRYWDMPLVSIHPDSTGNSVTAVIRVRYAK